MLPLMERQCTRHRVLLVVALRIGLIMLASVPPYLPGRYDLAAATITLLAQLLCLLGLVLLPVGLLWLLSRRRRPRAGSAGYRRRTPYRWIAFVVSGTVAAGSVLAGLARSLAVGTVAHQPLAPGLGCARAVGS